LMSKQDVHVASCDQCVVLSGKNESSCLGRQKEKFQRDVKAMQDAFNVFEECRKPVIAAIHGACIGGAIDMVTACDLRYCTQVCSLVVGVVISFRSALQSSSLWNDS
jgi:enoyl-CoA hydratase/carnithine racemase